MNFKQLADPSISLSNQDQKSNEIDTIGTEQYIVPHHNIRQETQKQNPTESQPTETMRIISNNTSGNDLGGFQDKNGLMLQRPSNQLANNPQNVSDYLDKFNVNDGDPNQPKKQETLEGIVDVNEKFRLKKALNIDFSKKR